MSRLFLWCAILLLLVGLRFAARAGHRWRRGCHRRSAARARAGRAGSGRRVGLGRFSGSRRRSRCSDRRGRSWGGRRRYHLLFFLAGHEADRQDGGKEERAFHLFSFRVRHTVDHMFERRGMPACRHIRSSYAFYQLRIKLRTASPSGAYNPVTLPAADGRETSHNSLKRSSSCWAPSSSFRPRA